MDVIATLIYLTMFSASRVSRLLEVNQAFVKISGKFNGTMSRSCGIFVDDSAIYMPFADFEKYESFTITYRTQNVEFVVHSVHEEQNLVALSVSNFTYKIFLIK